MVAVVVRRDLVGVLILGISWLRWVFWVCVFDFVLFSACSGLDSIGRLVFDGFGNLSILDSGFDVGVDIGQRFSEICTLPSFDFVFYVLVCLVVGGCFGCLMCVSGFGFWLDDCWFGDSLIFGLFSISSNFWVCGFFG